MKDTVTIWHPNHPGVTSQVSRGSFERRSSKLGWLLADDAAPAPVVDERERLLAEAAELGLRVHPKAKNETIARKIADARAALGGDLD